MMLFRHHARRRADTGAAPKAASRGIIGVVPTLSERDAERVAAHYS
jgi:hypothetical protein